MVVYEPGSRTLLDSESHNLDLGFPRLQTYISFVYKTLSLSYFCYNSPNGGDRSQVSYSSISVISVMPRNDCFYN